MIHNDLQLAVTKRQLRHMQKVLEDAPNASRGLPESIREAMGAGVQSWIDELNEDIEVYAEGAKVMDNRCGNCNSEMEVSPSGTYLVCPHCRELGSIQKVAQEDTVSPVTVESIQQEINERHKQLVDTVAQAYAMPPNCNKEVDVILIGQIVLNVEAMIAADKRPQLGCATTRQLLEELTARSDLDYRTIDS